MVSEKCETLYNKLNNFVTKVINRDVQPQIDDLESDVNSLNISITNKTEDTGWQTVSISNSSFATYSSGTELKVRKIGKIVEFSGQLKNTGSITLNTTEVTVATIPEEYRPSRVCYGIMQGSGTNIFLLSVNTNGQVKMSRYRANTTTYSSISSGAWFPLHMTYSVN